jgi:preprotein translocase subunit SecD
LAACFLVIAALYAGVFAGSQPTPKLGLDLRGGTSVILKPQLPGGATLSKSAQSRAVEVIRERVNGLGVSEADVQTQGNNVIVSVPGAGTSVVDQVGKTGVPAPQPSVTPSGSATPAPSGSASPSPSVTKQPSAKPSPSGSAKGRAMSSALLAAGATATPLASASTQPAPTPSASGSASPASACKPINESTACVTPQLQAAFAKADCRQKAYKEGGRPVEDPNKPFVACSSDGTTKYLLAPAQLVGKDVKSADAVINPQNNQWLVELNLSGSGGKKFGDITKVAAKFLNSTDPSLAPLNQVAIELDGVVQSSPSIQEPILGGKAQISGGNINQQRAEDLASVLKYGALPVSFVQQSVQSVSASLGNDELRAGLLAGAIGLALVLVYSLLYYRGLGLVTILSLAISGVTTYASVTVLGEQINYRLSLAGIAGFIVAVGITADSFVVFFERLRDEIREGRTLRSGVERAWVRARRTIISADVVSLLAAVILYYLSVGNVRGFAFTLGLSTVTDLFVVFFFTKPLITLLARTKLYGGGGAFSGLGRSRVTHAAPVAAGLPASSATRTAVKEA